MDSRSSTLVAMLALVACSRAQDPAASSTTPTPGAASTSAPAADARARNIVLVTLDTLCADELGCYGNAHHLTPNLDELARRGTRFERASAPMPETGPSHAAILSGRYPLSHGLTNNYVSLAPEVDTLGKLLLHSGFATGAFVNVFPFDKNHVAQGFQRLTRDLGRPAENVAPRLAAWLDEQPKEKPFFAWLHYYIAHTPYDAPQRLVDRCVQHPYKGPLDLDSVTRARMRTGELAMPDGYLQSFREHYDAQVALLDERIGELLNLLEARNLLSNTLLILVADHGESFDAKSLGLHAYVATQQTLHVPLIVVGPGVAAGASVPEIVELVDLCPTILELANVPPPPLVQGRSLWPLLHARTRSGDGSSDASGSVEWEGRAFASLPTLYDEGSDKLPDTLTCWKEPWKLVVTGRGEEAHVALFDLEHDPDERTDVAATRPEVVRALRRAIDEWIERTRANRSSPGEKVSGLAEILRALGYAR